MWRWHSKSSLTTSFMNSKQTYEVMSRSQSLLKQREHTMSPTGWRSNHWLTHHPCTVRSLARMLLKQTGNTCNSTVLVRVESSWNTTIKGRLPYRKQKKQCLAPWRSKRPELYITSGSQTKSAKPSAGRKLQSPLTTIAASFSHFSTKLIWKSRKTQGWAKSLRLRPYRTRNFRQTRQFSSTSLTATQTLPQWGGNTTMRKQAVTNTTCSPLTTISRHSAPSRSTWRKGRPKQRFARRPEWQKVSNWKLASC